MNSSVKNKIKAGSAIASKNTLQKRLETCIRCIPTKKYDRFNNTQADTQDNIMTKVTNTNKSTADNISEKNKNVEPSVSNSQKKTNTNINIQKKAEETVTKESKCSKTLNNSTSKKAETNVNNLQQKSDKARAIPKEIQETSCKCNKSKTEKASPVNGNNIQKQIDANVSMQKKVDINVTNAQTKTDTVFNKLKGTTVSRLSPEKKIKSQTVAKEALEQPTQLKRTSVSSPNKDIKPQTNVNEKLLKPPKTTIPSSHKDKNIISNSKDNKNKKSCTNIKGQKEHKRKSCIRKKSVSKNYLWKDLMATPDQPKWKDIMKNSRKFKMTSSLMQVLHDGGIKLTACAKIKETVEAYLTKYPRVVVQLIIITDECKSIDICRSAVATLYQIFIKSCLFNGSSNFEVMEYLKSSQNFVKLVNSTYTINKRFGELRRHKSHLTHLYGKLLEIIIFLSNTVECLLQTKKITKDTVLFMCKLLKEQDNKELLINILVALNLFCFAKKVRHVLACSFFYDSLCSCYKSTQKLFTVVSILRSLTKSKSSLLSMSQHDKLIILLLEFVNHKSKAPLSKNAVLTILYKIASTDIGLKILSKSMNYNKLYYFFLKNEAEDELESRIKAYSILSLCINKTVLAIPKLELELDLPENVRRCVQERNGLDDSEPDDESDEDSSDADNDSDGSSHNLKAYKTTAEPSSEEEALSEMEGFFREFSTSNKTVDVPQFRIFHKSEKLTPKHIIERRIQRLTSSDRLAFPDALRLMPTSENREISVGKFPLQYLLKKLKLKDGCTRPAYIPQVVYNLDELLKTNKPAEIPEPETFMVNNMNCQDSTDVLKFESRFECGNLRKATRVEQFEYDLILSSDTCSSKGHQWFYFQVSNMKLNQLYTINIVNFTKDMHLYNDGMQPVIFSATYYKLHRIGWKRGGEDVVYYGNHYISKNGHLQYKTLSFCIEFPYICDYVYIAYHYPYTYTTLMVSLAPYVRYKFRSMYARLDKLCNTVNNANEVPLLTVTASLNCSTSLNIPLCKRPLVFITGRVHPGETNASWIMEGIINFLLNESDPFAITAREYYIFKVVPMLNPEGVIHGNTRRGLTGRDLNRRWSKPNRITCPEIYYAKRLIEYAKREARQPIAAYIDIHGHSQQKFSFFYGCNPKKSWNSKDRKRGDWADTLDILPQTIQKLNPNLSLANCNYTITKCRESTGRVVMWRQLGITQSYTLECTYSEGYRKQAMNTRMLAEIGESVVTAFGKIADSLYKSKKSLPAYGLDYGNIDNWESEQRGRPSVEVHFPSPPDTFSLPSNQYVRYFFRF